MQITKFKWEKQEPFFILHSDNKTEKIQLFDNDIDIKLGERFCIGYFNKKYIPCPRKAKILQGYHCNECRLRDYFFVCVQCDGSSCLNFKRFNDCKQEKYYIYLAAFSDVLKVGISIDYRFRKRLIEQGADFGVKIATLTSGKEVRMIEQKIKRSLGIADRINGNTKRKLLFGDPNISMTNIIAAIHIIQNEFSEYLIRPEIYDFRKYYRLDNVMIEPQKFKIIDGVRIHGRIVAAKGNILIIENSSYYTLNAHEFIGREIFN